jgi:putative phosphoribosyl transferase
MTLLPALPLYSDRAAAGRAVAAALGGRTLGRDVIVLGLPRGGAVVASEVAAALRAPLDVVVARKLGVPGLPEVALGALVEGRHRLVQDPVRWYLGVPRRVVARIVERERAELKRRVRLYRGGASIPTLRDRTVILVDDGLASGATLRAAALAVRDRRPARVIAAVPVASPLHCDDVRESVDELITLATPDPFETVSAWYDDFAPVGDAEVLRVLSRTANAASAAVRDPIDAVPEQEISIPLGQGDGLAAGSMMADLGLPHGLPNGLAILAHGGGSSRKSYRNRYLAGRLRDAGWATLRVDLLLEGEQVDDDRDARARFDIPRIARRLLAAAEWAAREGLPGSEHVVLAGASTGAAAALVAAATRPDLIAAVASRGGRVDLAGEYLRHVRASVIMIVGSRDTNTLRWTRESAAVMRCPKRLTVIRGAGHTFDEPGMLGPVGEAVVKWFARYRRRGGSCFSTRPGRASVNFPSATTGVPFTITQSMPTGY